MLELSRRNLPSTFAIRVFDNEFNMEVFNTLTIEDITGIGRIRPVAARHFAERAEAVQNLNMIFSSPLGQNPQFLANWSMLGLSKFHEAMFDLESYKLVSKNVGLAEQADAAREIQVYQEKVAMEGMTPSGMSEDDTDQSFAEMGMTV